MFPQKRVGKKQKSQSPYIRKKLRDTRIGLLRIENLFLKHAIAKESAFSDQRRTSITSAASSSSTLGNALHAYSRIRELKENRRNLNTKWRDTTEKLLKESNASLRKWLALTPRGTQFLAGTEQGIKDVKDALEWEDMTLEYGEDGESDDENAKKQSKEDDSIIDSPLPSPDNWAGVDLTTVLQSAGLANPYLMLDVAGNYGITVSGYNDITHSGKHGIVANLGVTGDSWNGINNNFLAGDFSFNDSFNNSVGMMAGQSDMTGSNSFGMNSDGSNGARMSGNVLTGSNYFFGMEGEDSGIHGSDACGVDGMGMDMSSWAPLDFVPSTGRNSFSQKPISADLPTCSTMDDALHEYDCEIVFGHNGGGASIVGDDDRQALITTGNVSSNSPAAPVTASSAPAPPAYETPSASSPAAPVSSSSAPAPPAYGIGDAVDAPAAVPDDAGVVGLRYIEVGEDADGVDEDCFGTHFGATSEVDTWVDWEAMLKEGEEGGCGDDSGWEMLLAEE